MLLLIPFAYGEEQIMPVPFNKLIEYLPDPSGWKGGDAGGGTVSTPSGSWSSVDITYSKGGKYVDVIIFDSGSAEIPYWDMWDNYVEFESGEGYRKAVKISGYPAWETFDKNTREYSIFVGIDKRFGIIISTDDTKETLYDFASSIDYNGISDLSNYKPGLEKREETEISTPGFKTGISLVGLISALYILRNLRN